MVFATLVCLTNLAFNLVYDTDNRCPSWVEYELRPEEIIVTNRIPNVFHPDVRIWSESDNNQDYVGSGYDRGHMAPAADFNFSMDALRETYRFTNICPQTPILNRGEWAGIEAEVRRLAIEHGPVKVLTFPEYNEISTNRIGTVRIPDSFVKVVWGAFGIKLWRCTNKK